MSTETVTLAQLPGALRRVQRRAVRAVNRAMHGAARKGVTTIRRNIRNTSPFLPIDRGTMVKTVAVRVKRKGYDIISQVPYAKYMESGTRPHTPPWTPIFLWAQRKLGIFVGSGISREQRREVGAFTAYVRKRISVRGIHARKFGAKALPIIYVDTNRRIRSELRKEFV